MPSKLKSAAIWPLMGIHAQDTKHAGAWRLHVLASTLDHCDCGHLYGTCKSTGRIQRARLEAEALALGVKRSTFYSWLADARAAKILNGTREYLHITSQERVSVILFCNSIDEHKAIIPIKLLFKPGWKALVFAAYLKSNHHKLEGYTNKLKPVYKGKVISAKTLDDLTGVQPRAQRRYKQFVKTQQNIVITTIRGDWETANRLNQAAKEHGESRHYFTYNDPQQKDPAGIKNYRRVIAFTIPARRTVANKHAEIGARGRRAQIEQSILKGLQLVDVCNYSNIYSGTTPVQAARQIEAKSYKPRRYFDKPKNILLATMQNRDWTPEEAREVYVKRARGKGVFDRELR